MTKTLSILSISLGLLTSACATGLNYPGATETRHYELVSLDTEDWVYRESCKACEQGLSSQETPPVVADSAELSPFGRLYPTRPLSPVRGVHQEPVTP